MGNESENVPEKPNEDVEMKNAGEDNAKEEPVPMEDPTASPLTRICVFRGSYLLTISD